MVFYLFTVIKDFLKIQRFNQFVLLFHHYGGPHQLFNSRHIFLFLEALLKFLVKKKKKNPYWNVSGEPQLHK